MEFLCNFIWLPILECTKVTNKTFHHPILLLTLIIFYVDELKLDMNIRKLWDHLFRTFVKLSEKLTLLTTWYTHVLDYFAQDLLWHKVKFHKAAGAGGDHHMGQSIQKGTQ